MKMNLENLFYTVQEHFENTRDYHRIRLECWENQNGQLRKIGCTPKNCSLYVDHLESKDAYKFAKAYERSERGERAISDFCDILDIDREKLYNIVKAIIKWHDKREWQVCFPFTDKNSKTILEYIQT
jgi:hypothetical protein